MELSQTLGDRVAKTLGILPSPLGEGPGVRLYSGDRMAKTLGIPLPSPLGEGLGVRLFLSFHPFAQILNNIFGHFCLRFKAELLFLSSRNNAYHVVVCSKTSALVAQRVQHNEV